MMVNGVFVGRVTADVKCYFCGHISGQIIGRRHERLSITNFVPRPGYKGPEVRQGTRLRCERCQGPVFLEDTSNVTQVPSGQMKPPTRRKAADKQDAA